MSTQRAQQFKTFVEEKFGLNCDEEMADDSDIEFIEAFKKIADFNDQAAFSVSETRFFEFLFKILNDVDFYNGLDEWLNDVESHRVARMRAKEE